MNRGPVCRGGHTGPRPCAVGMRRSGILPGMSRPDRDIRMIDVGGKPVSRRAARATARLRAQPETVRRVRSGALSKGDAVATARIAGIMAAKHTADIVPLCHPLPLDAIEVTVTFPEADVVAVEARVRATARTGVEMEALVAATAAVLTIYDMTKAIDPGMTIESVRLEEKTGGVHGDYVRGG
jgi:cyclic pyranopterin phosphate synthase